MIAINAAFPLGVYFALDAGATPNGEDPPEWPISPVRLIGALLASAHEVSSDDLGADRAVIQMLCDSPVPPTIIAPHAKGHAAIFEMFGTDRAFADQGALDQIRGATRWVPRNPSKAKMKKEGVHPTRPQVGLVGANKAGTVTGDRHCTFVWNDLELTSAELNRLRLLASNVAWLGTSRSPVVLSVFWSDRKDSGSKCSSDEYRAIVASLIEAGHPAAAELRGAGPTSPSVWRPLAWDDIVPGKPIRVPEPRLILAFDRAHAARRSTKGKIEPTQVSNPTNAGAWVNYVPDRRITDDVVNLRRWSTNPIILKIDREKGYQPRIEETYLLARSWRRALLAAFDVGSDAPQLLTARGDEPHAAITTLVNVGFSHSDGSLAGVAIWLPYLSARDYEQRARIITAVDQFMPGSKNRRAVDMEGRGPVFLAPAPAFEAERVAALTVGRYARPSTCWLTALPVTHSRQRTSTGPSGIRRQLEVDFANAGIPFPDEVYASTRPFAIGAAPLMIAGRIPDQWVKSIEGPKSHLAFRFHRPVYGPMMLGRSRFFGGGLCVPVDPTIWGEAITAQFGDSIDAADDRRDKGAAS